MRLLFLATAALLTSTLAAADSVPRETRPLIVVVGDSLSAGYGLAAGQSFPDQLQRMLDAVGYKYRIVNQSISGDTTAGGLSRISQATALRPEVIVLELGGNDGLRGLPVSQTKANLAKMIVASQRAGAKVVLAGLTLPPNYGPDYVSRFEKMYPELAAQYQTSRVRFLLEGVALVPGMMLQDGIHPTARGADQMARNVYAVVAPLLKR